MADNNALTQTMLRTLNYDELTNCMRCGFCQPACPTFKETGFEASSPRGRIALMKAVTDGLMEPDQAFRDQMDQCLGCRACEPVCPADVKYGQLIEQTRFALEQHAEHRGWVKAVRSVLFRHLFPHPKRMRFAGGLLRFYQKSGLRRLARAAGLVRLFGRQLSEMESILPDASRQGVVGKLGGATVVPAKGGAAPIARVGLFSGCIMDVLFAETNVNTVRLLTEAGFEVVIPPGQNCCGALHAHSGELPQAQQLARANVAAFKAAGVDYIASNAGGCGALLIEYDHLLHDDPEWAEDARWFAARVKDISLILLEKGRLPEFAARPEETRAPAGTLTVTYQDSCHLRNVMKQSAAPRQLVGRVLGASFVELAGSDRCCGSAGIYNVVQEEMANQILEHKMEHVRGTNARYLVTSNPGCLLQMKLGIRRAGLDGRIEAVHVVDFLAERMRGKEPAG